MNKNLKKIECRIIFICPIFKFPTGGIIQIHRQAEILIKLGYNSFMLHDFYNRKNIWLDYKVPILYNKKLFFPDLKNEKTQFNSQFKNSNLRNILKYLLTKFRIKKNSNVYQNELTSNDILVVPEFYLYKITTLFPNYKKVLYAQGWSQLFLYQDDNNCEDTNVLQKELIHVFVNSKYTSSYINYLLPKVPQSLIRHAILPPFEFVDKKKKIICYTSRRSKNDCDIVVQSLKARKELTDWRFVDINKNDKILNSNEFAQKLKESAIFLSFSNKEGFGLPPAEAMKCGCIVIGYTGYGGRDYFLEEFSYPIEEQNIWQFIQTVESVAKDYDNPQIKQKGRIASDFISNNYNKTIEQNDIKESWSSILKCL